MKVSDRDQGVLTKLRALLAQNATLVEAAAALGSTKSTVHRLADAHELPRRRRPKIEPAQERKIARRLSSDEPLRVIARWAEVSKSTVHRRKQTRLKRVLGPGPKQVAPYTCPRGHRTTLDPCVACRALAAQSAAREKGHHANDG